MLGLWFSSTTAALPMNVFPPRSVQNQKPVLECQQIKDCATVVLYPLEIGKVQLSLVKFFCAILLYLSIYSYLVRGNISCLPNFNNSFFSMQYLQVRSG